MTIGEFPKWQTMFHFQRVRTNVVSFLKSMYIYNLNILNEMNLHLPDDSPSYWERRGICTPDPKNYIIE